MNISREFNPNLSHNFFFIRRGLFCAIRKYSRFFSGKLLDFGCGSKPYRDLFSVDEYIGLDFEITGHDHRNEQIDIYYDGKIIPFSDEHFDGVLCSEVAEHIFDLPSSLAEINRVLKPGGKLLLTCPFVWPEHEVPYDYARYSRFALEDLMLKSGFRVIIYEKYGNFIEAITQMRVLYFAEIAQPFFAKFSYPGAFFFKAIVFLINSWGCLKSWLLAKRYDLYLSNVILAEKL